MNNWEKLFDPRKLRRIEHVAPEITEQIKKQCAIEILDIIKYKKAMLLRYRDIDSRAVIYFQKLEREIKHKYLEGGGMNEYTKI